MKKLLSLFALLSLFLVSCDKEDGATSSNYMIYDGKKCSYVLATKAYDSDSNIDFINMIGLTSSTDESFPLTLLIQIPKDGYGKRYSYPAEKHFESMQFMADKGWYKTYFENEMTNADIYTNKNGEIYEIKISITFNDGKKAEVFFKGKMSANIPVLQ